MLVTGEEASISKKQIHQRLLKRAGSLWGIEEQDLDNFDPLINLLLEVFSQEYAKIGHEVASSNSRVLEVLSEILVPDKVFSPLPAHGLALLNSLEQVSTIGQGDMFISTVELVDPKNNSPEKKTFHFTPLDEFTLVQASVETIVFGDNFLYKKKAKRKYQFFDKPTEGYVSDIYIGLTVSGGVENLKGAIFSLEFTKEGNIWERMSSLLQWSNAVGQPLDISKYYKDGASRVSENNEKYFKDIVKEIRYLYEDNLFVLNTDFLISGKEGVPNFSEELKLNLPKGPLFWIKMSLPYSQPIQIFEGFDLHINAVPLINAKKEDVIHKLSDFLNIVPIQSSGKLLSVEKIQNDNFELALKNSYNARTLEKGTYVIRHSGVKRFDKRSASEILDHLLDLLRDEIAAFSGLHDDHFTSMLKEIKQLTVLLEYKISDKLDGGAGTPFLFVNPYKEGETLYISYWTTDGDEGNKVPRGSKILPATNFSVISSNNRFLVTASGGKDRLNRDEKLHALKRALISRNRVVTREDLKALSFEVFGNLLEQVEIKEGVGINNSKGGGYTRTIQVHLTPNNLVHKMEWEVLVTKLRKRIDNESFFVIPVEIKYLDL